MKQSIKISLILLINMGSIYGSETKQKINVRASLERAFTYIQKTKATLANDQQSFARNAQKHLQSMRKFESLSELLEQNKDHFTEETITNFKENARELIALASPYIETLK